jgi:CheY-like chemotaxis protein
MSEILVIDDDQSILGKIEKFLNHLGYGVKLARDGAEGIELLREGHNIGMVITDIHKLRKDGNEVATYIWYDKKLNKTPIVAITGFPGQAEKNLFDSVIPEPFKFKDLIGLIHSYDTS